ncbi:MAG: SprT-like domain-containing protein [Candidatus Heimdallarchaeaceae archaeon]
MEIEEVKSEYQKLKKLFFGSRVPKVEKVRFEISKRLTTNAACCWKPHRLIKLSYWYIKNYIEKGEDSLGQLLAHEMIHLYTEGGHDRDFKKEMKRINRLAERKLGIPDYVTRYSLGKAKKPKPKKEYL